MTHAAASALSSKQFQRLLPDWLKAMSSRTQRLERDGWDINMLQLLHDDTRSLAQDCRRFGAADFGVLLTEFEQKLSSYLQEQTLPQIPHSTQLMQQLQALAGKAAQQPKVSAVVAEPDLHRPSVAERESRDTSISLDPALHAELAKAFPRRAPNAPAHADLVPGIFFEDSEFSSHKHNSARREKYRLYHFSDGNAYTRNFDPLFETQGHTVTLFESLDILLDALKLEVPHLLVLDASLLQHAAALKVAAENRNTHYQSMQLLTFCAADKPKQQLAAVRAGIDVLIALPTRIEYVLQRIHETLGSENKLARVMIIENDTAQLRPTEEILGSAGMQTLSIANPFSALSALDEFQPDLIVIDQYLEVCEATELTQMIRARQQYMVTPILLLSGENDANTRLQALACGSDDLVPKPINPNQLVGMVKARLHRAQQLIQHSAMQLNLSATQR